MAQKFKLDANTVLIAGVALGGFFIVRKLLVNLGLATGAGERRVIREQEDPNSPFKPSFYKTDAAKRNNALVLRNATATELAKKIWNALNWYADDTAAVIGVFSSLQTQSQVSYLAETFLNRYNQDLLAYLQEGSDTFPWNGLGDNELSRVKNLVSRLPKYRK